MQYGDLSNRTAPTIAFRYEDFLMTTDKLDTNKRVASIIEKTKDFIKGNYNNVEVDKRVEETINYIFRHTDMNSYLIVNEETKINSYEEKLLEDIGYSKIVYIRKPIDVTRKLMLGEYLYYVDENSERMSLVNHNNCITLSELALRIRR